MRKEYDIRGGVRGKYYERYREKSVEAVSVMTTAGLQRIKNGAHLIIDVLTPAHTTRAAAPPLAESRRGSKSNSLSEA